MDKVKLNVHGYSSMKSLND